ncbi:MAG: hypothetical protein ACI8W8_002699 [Rhodothermales bacterium]|jgi:hypothetical protein
MHERLAEPCFMDHYAPYTSADTSEFLGDLAVELVNEFGLDIEDWGEGASWRLPGNNVLMAVGREGGDRYMIRPLDEDHESGRVAIGHVRSSSCRPKELEPKDSLRRPWFPARLTLRLADYVWGRVGNHGLRIPHGPCLCVSLPAYWRYLPEE